VVIVFDVLLVLCVGLTAWFAVYVVHRLTSDE